MPPVLYRGLRNLKQRPRTTVTTPWLSVVMPTYNGAAHLPGALGGLLRQRDAGIEVVAVDDGSTDATLDLLRAVNCRLPVRVVRRDHTGNWVANTNHGLSVARGEWVCFLHQDDLWGARRLVELRAGIARRPEATLWLHPSWFIDGDGRRLGLWRCPLPGVPRTLPPARVVERLLVQNFIAMPAPLFRRETALRVGGLDETLWYTADWDFWLKLAAAGPTAYLPRPLAAFRLHAQSQTVRRSKGVDAFRDQLERVLRPHLRAWEAAHPGRPAVGRAAWFAAEVNATLAAALHGHHARWRGLAFRMLALGPEAWHRFFRDSRIVERVGARLRANLIARQTPSAS
jgi:GT2 family glycosyltransferase